MQATTDVKKESFELPPFDSGRFENILAIICENESFESEWLNLLSQLEFVGCRKIMRSVSYDRIDLSVLQHISEEASHAFLLKSVCSSDGDSTWARSRLSPVGWRYFSELDRLVSEEAGEVVGCYPAVSWAIERRVLWVYPLYETRTKNPQVKHVIRRILAQEKRHGKQFDAVAFSDSFKKTVVDIERELWEDFCIQTENLLCANTSNV